MKAMTSLYYGEDTYKSIGTLSTKFTNEIICIDETTWNNGLGNFKMVNGGTNGVSIFKILSNNFILDTSHKFSGLCHRRED